MTVRNTLDRQIIELGKLLTIWPNCSADVAGQFISDTLGTSMSRVCLQQAKDALGLKPSVHNDKTVAKKAELERAILQDVTCFGVLGLTEAQFASRATKHLRDTYGEETNHQLIKTWVNDLLQRLAPDALEIPKLMKTIAKIREELGAVGIEPKEQKQTELL